MNNIYKYLALLLVSLQSAYGQHYQFSQFYSAPAYLNPAFTGANVCSRVNLNYRNQWAGIPGGFTTYQVSVDHTLARYKSGVGLQVFKDKAGLNGLSTTQVNFLYAYETRINKKIMGRAGISAGTSQRKVDYSAFTFGDQIARNDGGSSLDQLRSSSVRYFDGAAGILVFSNSAWGGLSAAHINQPNQSLTGDVSRLPVEYKLHGGYKWVLDEAAAGRALPDDHSVTIAFNYKKQAKFNQLDFGAYYNKDMIVLGCWYRGIPIFKPTKYYLNNDALVFLVGLSVAKCKIGYSYDLTLSKLTNANTNGSHELSMTYQFCKLKKSQRRKLVVVSCPKF